MKEPLIIDDVAAALAMMTEQGRDIVAATADQVRRAVLALAERRGWAVVRYGAFTKWAEQVVQREALEWVILDPLFEIESDATRRRHVRLTRRFTDNKLLGARVFETVPTSSALAGVRGTFGVVDDAVASGVTIRQLAHASRKIDATIGQIVVCASAHAGRNQLQSDLRGVRFVEYLPGDWSVVHLRDGCPYLPYTGKPTHIPPVRAASGQEVELRVSVRNVEGHAWQAFTMNSTVRQAIEQAEGQVVASLSDTVGRPAAVGDLVVLGQHVPAIVMPGQSAAADTLLASLASSR